MLGFPGISNNFTDSYIHTYIHSIIHLLDNKGIYILKIDKDYFNSNHISIEEYILPYFNLIPFINYNPILHIRREKTNRRPQFTERDQYKIYFLQKKNFKDITKLVIVAHADDETLFAFDVLDKNTFVLVINGQHKSNPEITQTRKKEFSNVMNYMECIYKYCNFIDKKHRWDKLIYENITNTINEVISLLPNLKTIYTHNKQGEYGHIDHIRMHEIVINLFTNSSYVLYVFNPDLNSNITINDKKQTVLNFYKSQQGSVDLYGKLKLDFTQLNHLKSYISTA